MQLHKHRIVRAITAFSIAVLLFFNYGVESSAAQIVSISDLNTQLAELETEEESVRTQLNEVHADTEQNRAACVELEEKIGNVQKMGIPAAKNIAPEEEEGLFLLYMESRQRLEEAKAEEAALQAEAERIALEKIGVIAAVDAWYNEYNTALEAAKRNSNYMGTGSFVWPVPDYQLVYCNFGYGHLGIDIAGSGIYGAPIVAADGGKVIASGKMISYGYCVLIDHGNGFVTRYAHASELACEVGDVVAQGQTIAYVGSSGYSTGPHLHYEILYNGEIQNPNDFY